MQIRLTAYNLWRNPLRYTMTNPVKHFKNAALKGSGFVLAFKSWFSPVILLKCLTRSVTTAKMSSF